MPLRVHCRCGQEVIVRYSEWVHVVLGLAILATIANVIVAIILFRDVRRLESEVEERVARVFEARESDALAKNAAGEERRAPTEASGAVRSGDDGSRGDASKRAQPPSQGPTLAGSNEAAERTPLESSAPRPNGGGAARSRTGPPKSDAEGVAANVETEKERAENDPTPAERQGPGARRSPPPSTTARAPLVATDAAPDAGGISADDGGSSTAIARLFEQLELLPSDSDTSDAGPSSRPQTEVSELTAPIGRKLLDWPPIARLALLSRAAKNTSETSVVLTAFLLDPDPRLRAIALDALESAGLPRAASSEARPLIDHALEVFVGDELADRLRALAGEPSSSSTTSDLEGAWQRAVSDARSLASRAPSLEAWRSTLQPLEEHGCDVVFLLDATRSMGEALPLLKESSAWLLPGLAWGVPSCRVGLVLYRDEVLDAAGLSIEPEREVLPLLLSTRAEGGGDVPEGVREAIEEGLSLGKFAWREDAAKHLIVVGDQPPRYEEIRALESLVANARRDGQYSFHFLGIPEEGSEGVAFFDRFAKAGGGRHANGPATVIGREAAACVLGADDPTIVSELFDVLPRIFGGTTGE